MKTALLLVDIQNDFLPGGALAVPDGDAILPITSRLVDFFELVFATQDWHPSDHGSFAANHNAEAFTEGSLDGLPQTLWPTHCVQGTPGAELSTEIDWNQVTQVCTKGEEPLVDSYSGFYDNGRRKQTELHAVLQSHQVDTLYVCGLATEYCVKFTVLDALDLGYRTFVVSDACRGLDSAAVAAAVSEMETAGASFVKSSDLLAS